MPQKQKPGAEEKIKIVQDYIKGKIGKSVILQDGGTLQLHEVYDRAGVAKVKEELIQSAKAACAEILRQNAAQFCRNTLCISKNCNKIMAQNFRKMPQTHLISASLSFFYTTSVVSPANCSSKRFFGEIAQFLFTFPPSWYTM